MSPSSFSPLPPAMMGPPPPLPSDTSRFLDRFPLTELELTQLWPLVAVVERSTHDGTTHDTAHQDPGVAARVAALLRPRVPDPYAHCLADRIPLLWRATQQTVFVLGFGDDQDDDDDNNNNNHVSITATAQHLETAVVLLGRRGETALQRALWQGGKVPRDKNHNDTDDPDPTAESMVQWLHALVVAVEIFVSSSSVHTTPSHHPLSLTAWKASLPDVMTVPRFDQWIANVAPALPFVLSTFFHHLLFGSVHRMSVPWSLPVPPLQESQTMSSTASSSSRNGPHDTTTLLRPGSFLADQSTAVPLVAMGLHGHVVQSLYQSTRQGLSFHTLHASLTAYYGATLLMLRTTQGDILGYYTELPWSCSKKNKPSLYDSETLASTDAYLFSLYPVWRRWWRTYAEPTGRPIQWLSHSPKDAGLSIGGVTVDTPRVHLTPTLENCRAVSTGRIFQDGPLLGTSHDVSNAVMPYTFDVEEIQLYAVAPTVDALIQGQEIGRRSVASKEAMRQWLSQVDKRQFVDDLVFLPGHLFAHRQQTRGRADFVADDDESKGYYIDDKPPSPHLTSRGS